MNYIVSSIPELINVFKIAKGKLVEKKAKVTTLKGTCFCCVQVYHWKRDYTTYLESRKQVACDALSTSGIYVIKVNTISPDNIKVYDTSCGSYIWFDM